MNNPPVFITARLGSTRLPRKHFLDMGGISVINHIIKRCLHFGFDPYVCVPIEDYEEFHEHTKYEKVFAGDNDNVGKRINEVSEITKINKFHVLDGDDPWFDERAVRSSFHHEWRITFPPIESESGSGICGVTYYFNSPTPFNGRLVWPSSKAWPQRLTLDYPEDHHLITAVNRMVGGYMAPRWAVDELFIRNPDLHKINWFRTSEWKARQDAEKPGN